jgi:hypothetical protein
MNPTSDIPPVVGRPFVITIIFDPGHRHRGGADPSYSGTVTLVAVWTLAGD